MTPESAPRTDLARNLLLFLAFGLMIGGSLWVLRPFLLPILWATVLVVASWPAFLRLDRRVGGRRGVAVGIAAGLMLLLLVTPIFLAIVTIVDHAGEIAAWSRNLRTLEIPEPPAWIASGPLGSTRIGQSWHELHQATPDEVQAMIAPRLRGLVTWFAGKIGDLGAVVVEFLLVVAFASFLYAHGERARDEIRKFAHRVGGERGDAAAVLASKAIRAVALGVGVTALVQSTIAGIGLALVGTPMAGFLAAVTLVLCIAQIGPVLVLLPTAIYYFSAGRTGAGAFLLVVLALAGGLDNVLRPVLIKRGADLPLALILLGVIGGLLGFGVIGLFLGPVILAVSYTLYEAWVGDERRGDEVEATTTEA